MAPSIGKATTATKATKATTATTTTTTRKTRKTDGDVKPPAPTKTKSRLTQPVSPGLDDDGDDPAVSSNRKHHMTHLQAAIQEKLAEKARRPFAIYTATMFKQMSDSRLSAIEKMKTIARNWKVLNLADKSIYEASSTAEFKKQHASCQKLGIGVRHNGKPSKHTVSDQQGHNPSNSVKLAGVNHKLNDGCSSIDDNSSSSNFASSSKSDNAGASIDSSSSRGSLGSGAVESIGSIDNNDMMFGPFLIKNGGRLIGAGSYGKVAHGLHTTNGRRVAIKLFKDSADEMLRELNVYKRLEHALDSGSQDVIVRILGHSESPLPWIAMPFVAGGSLHSEIWKETGPAPLVGTAMQAVVMQLVKGIEFLHSVNIVHLDIKPQNLLWDSSCYHLRIVDFGMAERCPLKEGTNGFPMYVTESYRPPELFVATAANVWKTIGPKVDVWSVGVTIFEAATAGRLMSPIKTGRANLVSNTVQAWTTHYHLTKPAFSTMPNTSRASWFEDAQRLSTRMQRLPSRALHLFVAGACHPDPENRILDLTKFVFYTGREQK